jgi:hypothetical protein
MFPTRSDRLRAFLLVAGLCGATLMPLPASAQEATLRAVAASEITLSRDEAALRVDFRTGEPLRVAIRGGRLHIGNRNVAAAPRGSDLDAAWRALLNQAMEVPSADLAALLADWRPPAGDAAAALHTALLEAVAVSEQVAAPPTAAADAEQRALSDSLARLQDRIRELERSAGAAAATRVERRTRGPDIWSPLRHLMRGLTGIISVLMTAAVLFGMAVLAILFGARPYIEGVADTAREATGRSFLVGLAATVLVGPAFIIGIVALAVSIVGIPALLLWLPGYPVAVTLAATLGYIALAHAAGEAVAQRRYRDREWFQRANSYYFIASGLLLLLAFFLAANVVQMAGPWLGFVRGMLNFFGVVVTTVVVLTGFGAVLISRGGTRPIRPARFTADEPDLFTEEAGV